jgi:hypothetical protein
MGRAVRACFVLFAFALSGGALAACGSDGTTESAASQAVSSTTSETKSAYLTTLEPDWAAYSAALAKESAACPVPEVTVETMNECKKRMLAVNKVDTDFIADLRELDVPQKVQPAVAALGASLAALNQAHNAIIHRYIDKQNIDGFEHSAGPGSQLDNATMGANDAITQINLLDPQADLEATVFVPPS